MVTLNPLYDRFFQLAPSLIFQENATEESKRTQKTLRRDCIVDLMQSLRLHASKLKESGFSDTLERAFYMQMSNLFYWLHRADWRYTEEHWKNGDVYLMLFKVHVHNLKTYGFAFF